MLTQVHFRRRSTFESNASRNWFIQINFKMISLFVLITASIFSLSEAESWPDGKYCLPMPRSQQCPTGWSKGIRQHDTEDNKGSSYCDRKKQGWVPYNINLCRNLGWGFCCKTQDYPRTGKAWPRGSYCIFRKGGHCPPHFHGGKEPIFAENPSAQSQ